MRGRASPQNARQIVPVVTRQIALTGDDSGYFWPNVPLRIRLELAGLLM